MCSTECKRDEIDLAESFKTMTVLKKEVKTAVSYHVNGTAGSLSRIVNPMLGGHIIFCVDRYNEGSTPEQLDLRTVRTNFVYLPCQPSLNVPVEPLLCFAIITSAIFFSGLSLL